MKDILSVLIVVIVCTGIPGITTAFGRDRKISSKNVLVETESFQHKGGWVVDQQFTDQMGSPYLMAHGLGRPVEDAETTVTFPETGDYYVFVRTFNWTSPWLAGEGPGKFRLLVNGSPVGPELGTNSASWFWQPAGSVTIPGNKELQRIGSPAYF